MGVNFGHVALEKRQSIERKHDSEAKRGVGRILLDDVDTPRREASLDEQRK
jgi:hypothetical protein